MITTRSNDKELSEINSISRFFNRLWDIDRYPALRRKTRIGEYSFILARFIKGCRKSFLYEDATLLYCSTKHMQTSPHIPRTPHAATVRSTPRIISSALSSRESLHQLTDKGLTPYVRLPLPGSEVIRPLEPHADNALVSRG